MVCKLVESVNDILGSLLQETMLTLLFSRMFYAINLIDFNVHPFKRVRQ